jgi:hypothetical protein
MGENRGPWDNSAAYPGASYNGGPEAASSGPPIPPRGHDLAAEQQAVRELQLATTSTDARGIGPLTAGPTAMVLAVVSVLLLWLLGGLAGFFFAVVSGALAMVFGLRARRATGYAHTRTWWLGTVAVGLTVVSLVGCFVLNVVAPDRGRSDGPSCVLTGDCPVGTGR